MTPIPVRLQPRLLRWVLTGGVLSYAVAFSIAGLHYAGLSNVVIAGIGVPLGVMAILFLFRDMRARMGEGTLTVSGGEIRVEGRGKTFFRVSTHQLHAEYGAYIHTYREGNKNWNGPAIRLSSPRSKRKLTIVSTWQSLSACDSKTTPEAPLWDKARNGPQVAAGDILLEGEPFDRLQEVLGIGDTGGS